MRLDDKSIVITGASGIAAATARSAAREGARVHVVSLHEEQCRELVSQIEEDGGDAGWSAADLTVESEARSALDAARQRLGRVDGLVAVAGGSGRRFGDGPVHEMRLEAWVTTFDINTSPVFLSVSRLIAHMRQSGGSVVVVGSVLATSPSPRLFATHAYAAAKGAANSFVTTLASYYARDRIRVNAIAPGLVRTPMSERAAGDEQIVDYSRRKQPLAGGFLDPGHIADTAVFLLSDESSQITGQVIAVDGGWSVTEA